jgi:ABC-type transport system involved in multi-copper enzyme maturation permease subunit
MRPYLAVLKDSFREALASRVLWILIFVTSVVLALLAPLGIKEQALSADVPEASESEESADDERPNPKERTGIAFSYLGWSTDPQPATRAQTTQLIEFIVAKIIDYFVGTLGVFVAILVTSPIIPQIFEPGAIDLLLSKPVSRSLLFLTKFFGGCAFITLIAAYFITGLWLIAGLRFDFWHARPFLAIPILLFLFSIYYSVSSLAGVIWRNAIVSVVVTILFWGVCFSIGKGKSWLEATVVTPERIVKLIPAGSTLLGATDQGLVRRWRQDEAGWRDVFFPEGRPVHLPWIDVPQPMIGPVYDSRHDRILALDMWPAGGGGGQGFFASGAPLVIGRSADNWKRTRGPAAPVGTLALLARPEGDIVALTKAAVYRVVDGESDTQPEPKRISFLRSGPEPALRLDASAVAAMNPDTGNLAIFSRGSVILLGREESGKYRRLLEKEIVPAKEATAAVLAFGNQMIVLALADGRVLVLDAADLSTRAQSRPAGKTAPRFAAASPGGRWLSVLFHNREFWLYDAREHRPADLAFSGRGDISAAAFVGRNQLWLVDRAVRATEYELDPFRIETRVAPRMSAIEITYRYVVVPIYTIFPKPGKMGDVVSYLLTDGGAAVPQFMRQDLSQAQEAVDVAGPVWSSLAFVAVLLAGTCLYVSRIDF